MILCPWDGIRTCKIVTVLYLRLPHHAIDLLKKMKAIFLGGLMGPGLVFSHILFNHAFTNLLTAA